METVQGGVPPYGVKETLVVNGKIMYNTHSCPVAESDSSSTEGKTLEVKLDSRKNELSRRQWVAPRLIGPIIAGSEGGVVEKPTSIAQYRGCGGANPLNEVIPVKSVLIRLPFTIRCTRFYQCVDCYVLLCD